MTENIVTYRNATLEEANTLGIVNAEAYAHRDGDSLPEAADEGIVSLIQKRMAIEGSWTRVAIDGEKVVGFALTYPRAMNEERGSDPPDTAQLSFIAVKPDHQGQGIASKLVDGAVHEARSAGLSWMALWTDEEDNSRARELYERKGFRPTDEWREGEEGKYADQVVYRLGL